MEYYSATKKKEILPCATRWVDLRDIMLSEMSEKERQVPYDFTYMWNLKHKTNEQNRKMNKTETDSQIQETNWWLPEKGGVGA